MLHFNEGSWGSIMKTMWYFPRVSLKLGLILPPVERKPIGKYIVPETSGVLQDSDNLTEYK